MKAIVDDEDYERVNQYNWCVDKAKQTSVSIYKWTKGNKTKKQRLSHFILDLQENNNKVVTYKNKNFLDLRKSNLLILDKKTFTSTRRGVKNSSSKYKGVHWDKQKKRWRATIKVKGKSIYLGIFKSEDEAAKKYNSAALKYFGEYSYQNVIGEDNSALDVDVPINEMIQRTKKREGYRGVYADEFGFIVIAAGKYIGWYRTEIEAAKAYNEKAKELFGDKAILNDIPTDEYKIIEVFDIPNFRDYPKVVNPEEWTTGPVTTKLGGAQLK